MKWENDENELTKRLVFQILRTEMVVDDEIAKKISMKKICDAIDKMFSDILEEE